MSRCRKVPLNKDFPAFPISMNDLDWRSLLTIHLTATAYVCHGPFLCLPHSGRKMHHSSRLRIASEKCLCTKVSRASAKNSREPFSMNYVRLLTLLPECGDGSSCFPALMPRSALWRDKTQIWNTGSVLENMQWIFIHDWAAIWRSTGINDDDFITSS